MATFDLPFQRRKVTTYGKAARKPNNGIWDFDASPEKPKLVGFTTPEESRLRSSPSKENSGPTGGKLTRPSPRKVQNNAVFDVPSSDDEPSPRTAKSQQLKLKQRAGNAEKAGREIVRTKDLGDTSRSDTENSKKRKRRVANSADDMMERIQAELRESYKEDDLYDIGNALPKKQRPSPPEVESSVPVVTKARQRKPAASTSKPKKAPAKGISAPAALQSMLSNPDTDSAQSPAFSSATPEPPMDVDFLPSTPPMKPIDSPRSGLGSGAVTPRQKDLWKKLIISSGPVGSPSELPISKLDLSSSRKLAKLTQSSSETAAYRRGRRGRLVDMLKEAAPEDGHEEEQDNEEDEADETSEVLEEPSSDSVQVRMPPPPLKRERSSQLGDMFTKTSTKVTYAQQRSYLEEHNEDEAFDMLVEEMGITPTANVSQSQQMTIDEEDEEDESQPGQPRSVHDLRAAGTKRRLLHDLEALVNEVGGQGFDSLSAKRSALVELTMKLFDQETVTCCLDHGLDFQIVKNCSRTDDTWFNFAAITAIGLLIDGGANAGFLASFHDSKCFSYMSRLLDNDKGDINKLIKDRRANLSKIAQSTFLDLRTKLLESDFLPTNKPVKVSPRLVAAKTVDLFVRRVRELGSQDIILDIGWIVGLLATARYGLQDHVEGRDTAPDVVVPELSLSALESSTLVPSSKAKQLGWSDNTLGMLAKTLSVILSTDRPLPGTIEMLALRLTLNLTNNNPKACGIFATPAIVRPLLRSITTRFSLLSSELGEEEHLSNLDRLILALGALINLAEWSDDARLSVMDGSNDLLDEAVRLFINGRERAAEAESIQASQTNVAYGYLAVLLGNLCQNDKVCREVESKIPDRCLDPLIDAVEEFILFNQKVDKEAFEGDEGHEVFTQFTERLKSVVERLRKDI